MDAINGVFSVAGGYEVYHSVRLSSPKKKCCKIMEVSLAVRCCAQVECGYGRERKKS